MTDTPVDSDLAQLSLSSATDTAPPLPNGHLAQEVQPGNTPPATNATPPPPAVAQPAFGTVPVADVAAPPLLPPIVVPPLAGQPARPASVPAVDSVPLAVPAAAPLMAALPPLQPAVVQEAAAPVVPPAICALPVAPLAPLLPGAAVAPIAVQPAFAAAGGLGLAHADLLAGLNPAAVATLSAYGGMAASAAPRIGEVMVAQPAVGYAQVPTSAPGQIGTMVGELPSSPQAAAGAAATTSQAPSFGQSSVIPGKATMMGNMQTLGSSHSTSMRGTMIGSFDGSSSAASHEGTGISGGQPSIRFIGESQTMSAASAAPMVALPMQGMFQQPWPSFVGQMGGMIGQAPLVGSSNLAQAAALPLVSGAMGSGNFASYAQEYQASMASQPNFSGYASSMQESEVGGLVGLADSGSNNTRKSNSWGNSAISVNSNDSQDQSRQRRSGQVGNLGNLGNQSWMDAVASIAHAGRTCSPVKVICSYGGTFQKSPSGSLEYSGGETRLLSVSSNCTYAELSERVERVTGCHSVVSSSGSADGQTPWLRYQLPSDSSVYVDLLDDDDVTLMLDEWHEFLAGGAASSTKLRIFVQWRAGSSGAGAGAGSVASSRAQHSADETLSQHSQGSASHISNSRSGGGDDGSAGALPPRHPHSAGEPAQQLHPQHPQADPPEPGAPGAPAQPPHVAAASRGTAGTARSDAPSLPDGLAFEEMADRMEIISPKDITLSKFLGSGGYGEVYLGKWHSSEAAIKCLNPSIFYGSEVSPQVSSNAIVDLLKEANLLGSLRHPNVVWVYGIVLPQMEGGAMQRVESDGSASVDRASSNSSWQAGGLGAVRPPAMVTEFMAQGSLKGALTRRADFLMSTPARLLIALDAAKGMEYLHSKRIVHFDLKSANLLLGYRDRRIVCKVADFGLSKQRHQTYVSGVSSQRGTLPWIAPEIIKSPNAVDEKVDVYSFGIVMWELWTMREPYEGLNYHALLHQMAIAKRAMRPAMPGTPDWEGEPPPPLAPGWQALMERCWTEEPEQRPGFTDVVQELRAMVTAMRPARRPSRGPPSGSSAAGTGRSGGAGGVPKPRLEVLEED